MNERQRQYLDAMGIQVWVGRGNTPPVSLASSPSQVLAITREPPSDGSVAVVPASPREMQSELGDIAEMDWEALKARVAQCTHCRELAGNRTKTVFGEGKRDADWMIIGEPPGADEDERGEPFVGSAGQLLNEMLRAVSRPRETVYIANVIKSRPPGDRDPTPEEVARCEPYLKRQIQLVKPRIVLAVGVISAQNLLKTDTPIESLRGRVHDYEGTPLVVTYHPADLLRSPLEKRRAWEDLRLALKTFRESAQP